HSKNILIDDGKALITDFGISSRFNNTTASISGAGNNMVGIWVYIEPQCFIQHGIKIECKEKSDIYAKQFQTMKEKNLLKDYLNLYEKYWSSDPDIYTELSDEILSDEDYDANEGSNMFNSFEATKKRKCKISSTNDKNNNDQATLSTLISLSPENKRVRIEASDEQSWFQYDEINMQQLYEINIHNAQNATSRVTISSPHAKQLHALSSSNIISASNTNALCVGNTLQYSNMLLIVCAFTVVYLYQSVDGIGAINQMKISKYDLVFMEIVLPKLDDILTAPHQLLASHQDCSFYLSHEMNDVLAKPFSKSIFLKMLENYCLHLVMPKFQSIPRPFGISDKSKSASNSDMFSHSSDTSVGEKNNEHHDSLISNQLALTVSD
ncbi:29088_t:CDS:2, partial [Racocetra persica]